MNGGLDISAMASSKEIAAALEMVEMVSMILRISRNHRPKRLKGAQRHTRQSSTRPDDGR